MDVRRDEIVKIFQAALRSVDPYMAVASHADTISSLYRIQKCRRLYVIGFGKASLPMAQALVDALGKTITGGIIITPYGQNTKTEAIGRVKIYEARHPLPDENGMKATAEILKLLKGLDEHTLIVCLISGGGSALLVAPIDGITLAEKQETTDLLLKSGTDINELNTVRKHLSDVKGGRLAMRAYPAIIVSFILSDVIGDRFDVIASGPTAPDSTTYGDALQILRKFELEKKVSARVMEVLTRGKEGKIAETPKEGNTVFERVQNSIIGSNTIALDAAAAEARRHGFDAVVISNEVGGEAKNAGRWLARQTIEIVNQRKGEIGEGKVKRPLCLISGGETVVTVTGNGCGGRNTELALAYAMEIAGKQGITFLSAGTDGTDGPTDAAGAFVDGQTIARAKARGLDPVKYLQNNDSYTFFKALDDLFITGPTGTNVMDIQITLIA